MTDMYKLSSEELYDKYKLSDEKCPLCKNYTLLSDTYYEEYGRWIEEEYLYCSNCGFYHAWSYGNVDERAIYKRYTGFERFVHDEELNKEFLERNGKLKFNQEEALKKGWWDND